MHIGEPELLPRSLPLTVFGFIAAVFLKESFSPSKVLTPLSTILKRPELVSIPTQMWYHVRGATGELFRKSKNSSFASIKEKIRKKKSLNLILQYVSVQKVTLMFKCTSTGCQTKN